MAKILTGNWHLYPPPIQTLEYRTSCQTSGTVNNNSPISDYFHRDDHTQPSYFLGIV